MRLYTMTEIFGDHRGLGQNVIILPRKDDPEKEAPLDCRIKSGNDRFKKWCPSAESFPFREGPIIG